MRLVCNQAKDGLFDNLTPKVKNYNILAPSLGGLVMLLAILGPTVLVLPVHLIFGYLYVSYARESTSAGRPGTDLKSSIAIAIQFKGKEQRT